jgi:hypothetical protein
MMSVERSRYFRLDDIGSDIWKRIVKFCSFATLRKGLVADYEVNRATITIDVNQLGHMVEHHIARLA